MARLDSFLAREVPSLAQVRLTGQTKENCFQELDLVSLIYEGWELSLKTNKIYMLVPLDMKFL